MASGCSACRSSDRSPATGADRSACTRQVTLPGPKKPSSAGSAGTLAANAAAARAESPGPGNTSALMPSPCIHVSKFTPCSPAGGGRHPPDGELGDLVVEGVQGGGDEVV